MNVLLDGLPRPLRLAAGACLCLIVIAVGAWVALEVVSRLLLVLLPLILALLLTSVLTTPAGWLRRHGLGRGLAAFLTLLGAILVFVGIIAVAVPLAVDEASNLDLRVTEGIDEVVVWLEQRLGLDPGQIDRAVQEARGRVDAGALSGPLTSGVFIAIEIGAGALLAIVLVFFFLRDGERMWSWCLGVLPVGRRVVVDRAARRGWSTLRAYVAGITVIAVLNALLIGLSLLVIGVPLVLPLTLLTFVAAFVPIVGALTAGFAAAMVALATEGPTAALLVIAASLVVEQIESNVWEPVIMSRAVEMHPVVILLAVAVGGLLLGLVGVFLAVPLLAAGWQATRAVRGLPETTRGRTPLRRLARPGAPAQKAV